VPLAEILARGFGLRFKVLSILGNGRLRMLLLIAIVLLILWLLGWLLFHIAGALIHLLIVAPDQRKKMSTARTP
jgi:hypothetical protein